MKEIGDYETMKYSLRNQIEQPDMKIVFPKIDPKDLGKPKTIEYKDGTKVIRTELLIGNMFIVNYQHI